MRLRVASVAGLVIATFLGAFALAGPAQANSLAGKAAQAEKKAQATCAKVGKAKGAAKAKARVACNKAKADARKARSKLSLARKNRFFDVCERGCSYRKVQDAANAAGGFQERTGVRATVRIQPGTYNEDVFVDDGEPGKDFDGLTFMGVNADKTPADTREEASTVVMDGTDSKSRAISARGASDLRILNIYGKRYTADTFFVTGDLGPDEKCEDYLMKNLISSDTRSYGLFALNCYGGKMVDSVGWNHGDSAYYIGQTPCDKETWSNRKFDEVRVFEKRNGQIFDRNENGYLGASGPVPECQRNPNWTILENVESFQNVLGYSGTNSKYVWIKDSTFYNNGSGIVPNTLDSEKFEPNGWSKFTNNDIFWNNYNYFQPDSLFQTISNGLAELAGVTVNYPIGVGVVLFGSDGVEVRNNRIFGHEKWGVAAFSAPVSEALLGGIVGNSGDDAKNLNNTVVGNEMGRGGQDPNYFDFLNDGSGANNCFSDNSATGTAGGVSYVVGNSPGNQSLLYPACEESRTKALNGPGTKSFQGTRGVQLNPGNFEDPATVLGFAASDPAKNQECSMVRLNPSRPQTYLSPLTGREYVETRPSPPTCN